jgi:hypothetical protein
MTKVDDAKDEADAVQQFSAQLGRRAPDRIQARLDGRDGMAALCDVEAVLSDLWPPSTAKELVWLTRSGLDDGDRLHLQAFAADGELLCNATFRLGRRDA